MENLFVYGTLTAPERQRAIIGRAAASAPAALEGYHKGTITLGLHTYPIARAHAGARIEGLVLAVTAAELALFDRYETDAYRRVRVTLAGGAEAWLYCE